MDFHGFPLIFSAILLISLDFFGCLGFFLDFQGFLVIIICESFEHWMDLKCSPAEQTKNEHKNHWLATITF